MTGEPRKPGLMRSLGLFVGHVARAVRTDPRSDQPARREISRDVQETRTTGPDGERVVLRRTVIDEVEMHRGGESN